MFNEHGIKHLDVDIADRCNFACKYCYHGSNNNIKTKIENNVQDKLIDILKKEKLQIHMFGGEPLTNFGDIKKIVEESGIKKWGMTTNVSLLDNTKKEFILRKGGGVHVSIDGNEDAHNQQRVYKGGRGTYQDVIKNIPNALEVSPNDTARMTVQPEIAHLVYDSVLSIKELGFNSVAPMPVLEAGWSDRQWKYYDDCLKRLAEWNIDNPHFMIKNFADSIRGIFNPRVRTRNCGAGWGLAAISTDGEITPCHRFSDRKDMSYSGHDVKEYSIGNINEGGIDIKKLEKWRENFGKLPEECERCEVVFSCTGACPNVAARMNGNPNTIVPNHCRYMKLSMPHARWMLVQMQTRGIYNVYERMFNKNYKKGDFKEEKQSKVNFVKKV